MENIGYNLSELKQKLFTDVLIVEFTKLNGETRTMKCTMKPELIAETKGNEREIPHGLLVVTDVDKNEWRSFNFDQIVSISEDF